MIHKRLFFYLWVGCLLGAWALVPYLRYLQIIPAYLPIGKVLLFVTIQTAVLYGIVCFASYFLVKNSDLKPFSIWGLRKRLFTAVVAGIGVGLTLLVLDRTVFVHSLLSGISVPAWRGALASLYGAINEEVLLRLFFFTLLYVILVKLLKGSNRLCLLWVSNGVVAIAFGLGHLGAASSMIPLSSYEIARVLLLNGFAGLVFGWIYWSRGLWAVMIAHFLADLILQLF